jgi:hypothetical protein
MGSTEQETLSQIIGFLDDWRANQYGGAAVADAINNLTAVSGTATREELERIVETLEGLVVVMAGQHGLAAATQGTTPAPPTDPSDEAKAKVRENVARLFGRMGPRLGTGNEATDIEDAPSTVLDARTPILPDPLRAGGSATIYGAGLDAVAVVGVDGTQAAIASILPGEVEFTVPSGVSSGVVTVDVVLRDGTIFLLEVEAVGDPSASRQTSRKGGRS